MIRVKGGAGEAGVVIHCDMESCNWRGARGEVAFDGCGHKRNGKGLVSDLGYAVPLLRLVPLPPPSRGRARNHPVELFHLLNARFRFDEGQLKRSEVGSSSKRLFPLRTSPLGAQSPDSVTLGALWTCVCP